MAQVKVRQYVKRCGDIRTEHFPPYTPELNVIEVQWRVMKNAVGNRLYGDMDMMEKSIRGMIRKKITTPVKMSDYLRC